MNASQNHFETVLKEFTEIAEKNHSTHYALGYLLSLCIELHSKMPKREQKAMTEAMQTATIKQYKLMAEKAENRTFERV